MVDSLKVYDILKHGSIPEDQARAMTTAIQLTETSVTDDFKEAMRAEREAFAGKFATKADLAAMEVRLIRWMFVFWVGQLGTTIALIKFWR